VLEQVDREVSGGALVRGFGLAIPSADEGQTGQLHVVLLQRVLQQGGVAELAKPVFAAAERASRVSSTIGSMPVKPACEATSIT